MQEETADLATGLGDSKWFGGAKFFGRLQMVEPMGFEPTTSSMPSRRAPNCATAPRKQLVIAFFIAFRYDTVKRVGGKVSTGDCIGNQTPTHSVLTLEPVNQLWATVAENRCPIAGFSVPSRRTRSTRRRLEALFSCCANPHTGTATIRPARSRMKWRT